MTKWHPTWNNTANILWLSLTVSKVYRHFPVILFKQVNQYLVLIRLHLCIYDVTVTLMDRAL